MASVVGAFKRFAFSEKRAPSRDKNLSSLNIRPNVSPATPRSKHDERGPYVPQARVAI